MLTPDAIFDHLTSFPFPGATDLCLDGGQCYLTVNGVGVTYNAWGEWCVAGRRVASQLNPYNATPVKIHAEIARVLALVKAPADPPKPVRLARMEPSDLYGVLLVDPFPGAADLRLDKTGLHFTVGGVAVRFDGAAFYAPRYHVRSTLPHPSATNTQGVHAEIHRVLALVMGAGEPDTLQDRLADEIDRRKDVEAQLAKMADAHAVGAQREVAERDATIDELRTALETIAAHVGLIGSDQWAVSQIVAKVAEIAAVLTWEGMEAIYPADLVERTKRMATDAAQHLLDREFVADAHDARARLAAYLGMDGAGFAQIVEAIERGRSADEVVSLKLDLGEARTRIADLESELGGVRDDADRLRRDLDFMNQRRANAQKRVTDLEKQRDEYQAAVEVQRTRANVNHSRADKAEARVKRLLRQRRAAHAVLDEAGIGLESEGSPRWTLARRCRAAVEPVWGYLDALQAFDDVGAIVGVKGKTGERGFVDAVIARVKGSCATKDGQGDLDPLLSRHNAPVKTGDRTLSPTERAAFVIRRLTRAAQNARAEAAALRAEQEEIAEALGDAPAYAEHADGSLVGLNLVERIRARLT